MKEDRKMGVKFSDLKKKMKNIETIENAAKDTGFEKDTRFWNMQIDKKTGASEAIIRFLPAHPDEDIPWIEIFEHAFKNDKNDKWLIGNCPTTIKGKCPVCEANSVLWNSGIESNQKLASKRKRKQKYISNIYVVSDPSNPDNEGKVFLYKYGKQIHDKIKNAISPEYASMKQLNPFDLIDGANFIIRTAKKTEKGKNEFITFENSSFDAPSELLDGDETKLEKIWLSEYPLQDFLKPDKFESYEKLSERLEFVLGSSGSSKSSVTDDDEDIEEEKPRKSVSGPKMKSEDIDDEIPFDKGEDDIEDDDLEFFNKMKS